MTIGWHFDNTYSKLPNTFKEEIKPTPVHDPELVVLNEDLAKNLKLDFSNIDQKKLAEIFSGNSLPENTNPIAQAYAGHQFGHFTMLGDGRAVLLGEHLVNKNSRFDIQFKGSGRTSFSRGGDGRAALGPMLREYIISEAIYCLNIKTTRSLAVVKTGEKVVRENLLQGAILTRVASSHIRIGTFQYIAAKQNTEELKMLVNYTVDRHFPEIKTSKNKALDLLNLVMQKQCDLIVDWMRVGFIHGVMNTDNMAISGETIDYGPCAFMDYYDPETVFSSIDKFGRYAYSNQPRIAKWNLARFAECLLPLINKNEDDAIKVATNIINNFEKIYENKWLNMMRDKLGLFGENKDDRNLIQDLLDWMRKNKADYTNTFNYLLDNKIEDTIYDKKSFKLWKDRWIKRSKLNNSTKDKQTKLMTNANPLIIPRNHLVEEALADAENNDFKTMQKLLSVIKNIYSANEDISKYKFPAPLKNYKYTTFCGT